MQNVAAISKNQVQIEESQLYLPDQERAYLALIMKFPNLINEGMRIVKKEWLFAGDGVNAYVYEMMQYIFEQAGQRGWEINFSPLALLGVVRTFGPAYERIFLLKTDGMDAVRAIEGYLPYVEYAHFGQITHQLVDAANRVEIYRNARKAQEAVQNRSLWPDSKAIAQGCSGEMVEIAYRGFGQGDDRITKLSDAEDPFLVKCRINAANANVNLISLYLNHMPKLMGFLGGLRRKGLTVVTARPKTGKTSFAGAAAIQAAVNQVVPTLYLDGEMSREEMYSRSLSNLSRMKEGDILLGKFHSELGAITPDLQKGVDCLRQAPFYYMNVAGKSPEAVQAIIRQFRTQYVGADYYTDPLTGKQYLFSRPGMVIYDWLKLPDASSLKNAQEHQMLGFLTSALKDAANFNDLPILALGQNNRDAAKAKKASDWEDNAESTVAGSDRIAQFCTALLTLRNLSRDEGKQMAVAGLRPGFAPPDDGSVDWNSLKFNQVAHLLLNRFGPDFKSGIPLYLNRGTSWYQEMGDADSLNMLRSLKAKANAGQGKVSIPTEISNGKPVVQSTTPDAVVALDSQGDEF